MDDDVNKKISKLSIESSGNSVVPTIHCGNLSLKTTSSELKGIFKDFKISKVTMKKSPNGQYAYAFVSFEHGEDLDSVLDALNYTDLHEKEIIMSKYTYKSKRAENGNIFVNNLPKELKSNDLSDLFKIFGKLVTCKISLDSQGRSKGYGFVKFESSESAVEAVENCKNVKIGDKVLKVELYNPDKLKRNIDKQPVFTNCFIKNFPPKYTSEELQSLLEKYGEVTTLFFPLKEDGTSKGFAYANFKDPESAVKAIDELHNTYLFNNSQMEKDENFSIEPFYIQKSEKKKEKLIL